MSKDKKKALGRGLSALLSSPETDVTTSVKTTERVPVLGSVAMLKVAQIEANPFQPRSVFEEEALHELADSIKVHGIIQPVTVRKMGYDKYQLISGERRFRASQLAGLEEVPAYIRVANDEQMLEMALVENIQRENLDAIEIAISYKRLLDECKLTQEQLSEKVSKQRSTVTNYLRLLKLPADIQMGIREKKISMGHARALINIEDKESQITIYEAIVDQDLSVRQTEEMVRNVQEGKEDPYLKNRPVKKAKGVSQQDKIIQDQLSKALSAKVSLKRKKNGKGNLSISFSSEDDLSRIIASLSSLS